MNHLPRLFSQSTTSLLTQAIGFLLAFMGSSVLATQDDPTKIHLPPGFRAELVYTVPAADQGSWVSMAVDQQGRLIASDQYGCLYRIEPSPLGEAPERTQVERINVELGGAQGLLVHKDDLYVMVSTSENDLKPGLYRVTDSNGDDQYDTVESLLSIEGGGEHGPHAVISSPDGKSLYICAGNHTKMPRITSSRVPQHWGEDQFLPRIVDPKGHATGIKAPGGWICRVSLDGKEVELVGVGYRNEYDIAFNADGELFTFDADMEWDIGTPWFRPTRVCHVVSGSDYGWRTGNSKWPIYFPETIPPVADIGPGSPTGITFAYVANFPEHYQQALFIGDWSYGNIYAVHVRPRGSTYTATVEPFASAMPLAVTDIVVRPQDGAMYFTVGGRRTDSALYRIVHDGQTLPDSTLPRLSDATLTQAKQLRTARRQLEALHTANAPGAIEQIWPQLAHKDRFIRHAARIALEHQPLESWHQRCLIETNPRIQLAALLALVHSRGEGTSAELVKSLTSLDWNFLGEAQQLELLRIAELVLIRCDVVGSDERRVLTEYLDPLLPQGDHRFDRELSQLLVKLEAPGAVPRILTQLQAAVTSEQQIDFAIALSVATTDWTVASKREFFEWFNQIANSHGGHSYFGYLERARDRFVEGFSDEERVALAAEINAKYEQADSSAVVDSRPFVKKWTLDELVDLTGREHGSRNFTRGRRLFAAAQCSKCHRVAGDGSSVGPDLTGVGRRFSEKDLLQAIVEPSHQVSDQYQQMVFETNGRVLVGRILNLGGDSVQISTNMVDPKTLITVKRADIDAQYPSDVSIMPAGLLDTLAADEVLDLTTYLRSGGDADHALYKPSQASE